MSLSGGRSLCFQQTLEQLDIHTREKKDEVQPLRGMICTIN